MGTFRYFFFILVVNGSVVGNVVDLRTEHPSKVKLLLKCEKSDYLRISLKNLTTC